MPCSEGRNTHDVYVVLYSLTCRLLWRLEERTHIDVEATVCVARSYDLRTTVMSVLTHLSDHDTGLTTFTLCELLRECLSTDEVLVFA